MQNGMFGFLSLVFVMIALGVILSFSMFSSINMKTTYVNLYDKCLIKPDCCKLSVDYMRENSFLPVEVNAKCPEGYSKESLECPGTLYWCEPTDNKK